MQYRIEDNSVHLVVTSPPYINLREYSNWETVGSYLHDNYEWAEHLFNILVPGGHVCWNIQNTVPHRMLPEGDQPESGELQLYHFATDVINLFLSAGFEYKNEVIWYKGKSGSPQKLFGSYPHPRNHMITHLHEAIHMFKKPGKTPPQNKEESAITKEEWVEYAQSLWHIQPESSKSHIHSAPYPKEIPHRFIKLFSCVGDIVYDPFLGSGTTAEAAIDNKRLYIGSEMDTEYFEKTKSHLQSYSHSLFS